MDKTLQGLACNCLPKEFKEEVKYEYRRVATKASKEEYDLGFMHAHEGMFGIHNLTSVAEGAEIAEEGEAMHHCVFDAEYYRKSDSLILSARDRNGSRLETIEVNLRTFKVVQSRAKFNKISDFHAEILSLMQQNMHLIRRAKPTA